MCEILEIMLSKYYPLLTKTERNTYGIPENDLGSVARRS